MIILKKKILVTLLVFPLAIFIISLGFMLIFISIDEFYPQIFQYDSIDFYNLVACLFTFFFGLFTFIFGIRIFLKMLWEIGEKVIIDQGILRKTNLFGLVKKRRVLKDLVSIQTNIFHSIPSGQTLFKKDGYRRQLILKFKNDNRIIHFDINGSNKETLKQFRQSLNSYLKNDEKKDKEALAYIKSVNKNITKQ